MAIGDFDQVINAQNVTMTIGVSGEIVTIFNISYVDESIIDRRNARDGFIDTPTFSLHEIIADAVVSEDMYLILRALRQLTTRGALPTAAFTLVATNIGLAANDITETGTLTLRRMESKAPERGRYETTLTMRLTATPTVS